jgi:branched-chain amino acid transport system substrate-binding protein
MSFPAGATKRATTGILAASLAATALVGCGGSGSTTVDLDKGTGPIKVASIFSETGPANGYGLQDWEGTKIGVADINARGGVLGRKLDLTEVDGQSEVAKYTSTAMKFAQDPEIAVVHGGTLSADRAAMIPILKEANKLYFYDSLYEGGTCDKNTFAVGETPSQQLAPVLKWAVDNGHKKWYILAADYVYGQISVKQAEIYAKEFGAEVVGGPTMFDLSVGNFTDTISKIQASGADTIVSFLVGTEQNNFYKQWAASGLNKTTKVVSPVFGPGSEHEAVGAAGKGVILAAKYFEELPGAKNQEFVKLVRDSGYKGYITSQLAGAYMGWKLWAKAVEKAGSFDRDKVLKALESGITYDGPSGTIQMDGPSHHTLTPMYIGESTGQGGFKVLEGPIPFKNFEPTFEQQKCDLIKNPGTSQQFQP